MSNNKNNDKRIKEGWGGIDPGQGNLFPKFPEKDYKAIAKRERELKEKIKLREEAERKKKEEDNDE